MASFAQAQPYYLQSHNWYEADSAAESILGLLSFKEKLNELHGSGVGAFGVSILFSDALKPVKAGGVHRLGIPATVFADGPRGLSFMKGATAFPVTMARGASWDIDLEKRIGAAMAEEVRAIGANYSGAVCMNVLRHPGWGRAQETYGEDPYHLGEMAAALVAGIQQHHVLACVKHFAANSMENNRFGGSMNMTERTLREVYLPHFKKVIDSGAASVMSAYNKLNGIYCGENKYLLTDILRKEWGFKGYITSDWMWGLRNTVNGIKAGMNVEMPKAKWYSSAKIKKALRRKYITSGDIDKLVRPVLRTKILFSDAGRQHEYPLSLLGNKEHIALAREAAEKSAVLLKNDDNVLPLHIENIKSIAVIGSLAHATQTGDKGSSSVLPSYVVSPAEGLQQYLAGKGMALLTKTDTTSEVTICKQADVVVAVVGTTYLDEGEYISNGTIRSRTNPDKRNFIVRSGKLGLGGDRAYLHLHQSDIDLIKLATKWNKQLIVVLVAGGAITVEDWHNDVKAILQTFYNGMEGGNALASILFGSVNPSGKLPFTVPVHENDLPAFDSYAAEVEYGYYHGYTLFDKTQKQVRYPFGYGLSYTNFQITELATPMQSYLEKETIVLSCKVRNIGNVKGAEVVQLYVGFKNSSIDRPRKLLRAFKKIELAPGEEQFVYLKVPVSDLAWYNPYTTQWEVERMKYQLMVGNSSADAELRQIEVDIVRK